MQYFTFQNSNSIWFKNKIYELAFKLDGVGDDNVDVESVDDCGDEDEQNEFIDAVDGGNFKLNGVVDVDVGQ